ncbi:MAG: hypothetical protein ACPKNR_01805 [Pleomorphochaeta sp.]
MDSIEGIKNGKVLLTIQLVNYSLMLTFIREINTVQSVINIFNNLYEKLGQKSFKKLFCLLLSDLDTESDCLKRLKII